MTDRDALTITSRDRAREEIAQQVANFLNNGGRIDYVRGPVMHARPIGPVWWDTRGSGMLLNG